MMQMSPTDITNKEVRNISLMEFLLGVIAVGIAWGILTTTVNALGQTVVDNGVAHKTDIRDMEQKQEALAEDVGDIKSDIGVMKNNQSHYTDALKATASQQKMILQNQQKILQAINK